MSLVRALLVFSILATTLGQLGKIPFLPEGVNLYLADVALSLAIGWGAFFFLATKRKLVIPLFGAGLLSFATIAFVSLLWGGAFLASGRHFLVAFFYWARWVLYAGAFFLSFHLGMRDRRVILNWLIASGVVISLAGFAQLAIFPDWSRFAYLGWDPHKNRLLSTFFDPNFCGIYLVLVFNLLLDRLLSPAPAKPSARRLLFTSLLIVVSATLLTFSRSAWLALAGSVFVWGVAKAPRLLVVAGLLAFLAYFAVPRAQTRIAGGFDPDDSARLRFQSWRQTWEIAKDNLVLGVGFNAFRYAQEERGYFDWRQPLGGHNGAGADSSLLFVLATTGVVGLASFLATLLSALLRAGEALPLTVALLVALLLDSLFINSLFYSPVMLFLWLVLGVTRERVVGDGGDVSPTFLSADTLP